MEGWIGNQIYLLQFEDGGTIFAYTNNDKVIVRSKNYRMDSMLSEIYKAIDSIRHSGVPAYIALANIRGKSQPTGRVAS